MGKKKTPVKVVLDTNVIVSSILFGGRLAPIVSMWEKKKIIPFLSRETFEELRRVLEYPKFSLTSDETHCILYDKIVPFFEIVKLYDYVSGISSDPDDDIFLSVALAAGADYLVSGDSHLLSIGEYRNVAVITPSKFLLKLT
ncbi:MAG: putative toxin-antitoxin system toxin component, PIN family [Spirochaetota bacterium]